MKIFVERFRRSQALPWSITLLSTIFLIQAQPTCVSQEALTGEVVGASSGPTIMNQTGRELSEQEIQQLVANTDGERIVIVFLNPNPGREGPLGPPGPPGPQGPAGPPLDLKTPNVLPLVGEVRMWSGSYSAVPPGWIPCDGRALDPAVFPELFQAIGTRWSTAAGGFQVPDFRDRSPMGASGEAATGALLTTVEGVASTLGGSAKHTLTVTEMPAHTHGMDHTHDLSVGVGSVGAAIFYPGVSQAPTIVQTGPSSRTDTDPEGGGQPHSILDPYFAINYIIFAGR